MEKEIWHGVTVVIGALWVALAAVVGWVGQKVYSEKTALIALLATREAKIDKLHSLVFMLLSQSDKSVLNDKFLKDLDRILNES